MTGCQATLGKVLSFHGTGLHTSFPSTLTLHPAPAGTGIRFISRECSIPAVFENVSDSRLCTSLRSPSAPAVILSTVEHLLAALSAAGVDNVRSEVSGAEVPIMDGSAAPFASALFGNVTLLPDAPRQRVVVKREVAVRMDDHSGERYALIRPHPENVLECLRLDVTTAHRGLGTHRVSCEQTEEEFRTRIAQARTYCYRSDIERMRKQGLAKGGSLDNAVVLNDDGSVLNDDGWRFPDEVCRHKVLDCIGDLRLGGWFVGEFVAVRPGHSLNLQLLRALYRDPENYSLE